MKIVLATVGTTGDVVPYVALGRALIARGHQVLACAADIHRGHFDKFGVEFRAVGAPFSMDSFHRTLEEIGRLNQPFKQFELLAERVFLADPARQLADHLAASQGADLVVAHWFDYVAQEAAIKNGVRWAAVTLMPEIFRT